MDATLPKYMIREIGEDAKFGSVYSINPFMIIILVPLVSSYTGILFYYLYIIITK